jgi:hypothetical protein
MLVLWAVPSAAQNTASFIALTATDAAGATHTVRLGAHAGGTHEFDTNLGEFPVPPVPFPDMFDLRVLDHPDHPREPRTGTYTEIRPFVSASQADSFIVRVVTAPDAYPLKLVFSPDPGTVCDSLTLLYPSAGQYLRAAVDSSRSWSLSDPTITALLVIRHGVKFPRSSPR